MKKIKILISLSDGPFFRAEKNSAAEKFRLVLLGFIGYYIGIKKNDSRFYAIIKISRRSRAVFNESGYLLGQTSAKNP